MPFRFRCLLPFGLMLLLAACAPVMLGRTPTTVAPGKTETSLSLGYPFGLTSLPECEGCEYVGPAYWPLPLPLTVHIAYGRSEVSETNVGVMLSPLPSFPGLGVRYGFKERFSEAPVQLAYDAGASLYLTNIAFDGGVLAALPLDEVKIYGALRGFGGLYFAGGVGGGAALTVGGKIPATPDSSLLLELSLLTNFLNGVSATGTPSPVGFSLVPALSFTF